MQLVKSQQNKQLATATTSSGEQRGSHHAGWHGTKQFKFTT
jgi:hypothetical protein